MRKFLVKSDLDMAIGVVIQEALELEKIIVGPVVRAGAVSGDYRMSPLMFSDGMDRYLYRFTAVGVYLLHDKSKTCLRRNVKSP